MAKEIKLGDFVYCVHPPYLDVKGNVIKQYYPTGGEHHTMIRCIDGRKFHAPTKYFRKGGAE